MLGEDCFSGVHHVIIYTFLGAQVVVQQLDCLCYWKHHFIIVPLCWIVQTSLHNKERNAACNEEKSCCCKCCSIIKEIVIICNKEEFIHNTIRAKISLYESVSIQH